MHLFISTFTKSKLYGKQHRANEKDGDSAIHVAITK